MKQAMILDDIPPIPELNDPVVVELMKARIKLVLERPFEGQLGLRLQLVEANDWCKTAATDGRNFYFNRRFIETLTPDQVLFLMGHEIYHCIFMHFTRRGHRDKDLYNMACDYVINHALKEQRIGVMPSGGLISDKYTSEMSSEEVYELLKQNSVTIQAPLDMHLDLNSDGSDDGDSKEGGKTTITVYGENGPPKLTEAEIEEIQNEIRAQMVQIAQQLGAGKIPKGVQRLIDGLIAPKMNWKQLLDVHVRSSISDDYTYERFNPMNPEDCMLPSLDVDDMVELAVAMDLSGSIGEEESRIFVSEIVGITETFRDYKIHLWTFDTEVYNHKIFNPSNIDELKSYDFKGGGGTLFECNWEFMKENNIEVPRFVMFTDGLPNSSWGDPNGPETLFVIKGNPRITAPFGTTAHYEEEK